MRQWAGSWLRAVAPPLLVSTAVFVLYLANSTLRYGSDFLWAPHVTASLIYQRDPYLNEFEHWFADWRSFALYESESKVHSMYPLGGQVLIMPQAYLLDALLPEFRGVTLHEYLIHHPPTDPAVLRFQLINASLLVALSAGFMYLIGREFLSVPYALLLTATYAFGTAAYSTGSRAMWQHGPSMLMLAATLWLLVKARRRPALVRYAALPLAAAYIIRPTNSISVVVVTIYVLLCYRRQFAGFMLLALLVAVPFALANYVLYGALLPPYVATGGDAFGLATISDGLVGTLLSPGRGVFLFSPVLLLMPVGVALKARGRGLEALDGAVLAILLLHWLLIASFKHWWAGFAFGPRYFADVMPYAVFLLIPVLLAIQNHARRPARLALGGVFGVLLALSVGIHYRGATSIATWNWNNVPVSAHEHVERIWDWTDLQFLRGLNDDLIQVTPQTVVLDAADGADSQSFSIVAGSATDDAVAITVRLPEGVAFAPETAPAFEIEALPDGGQLGRLRESFIGPNLLPMNFAANVEAVTPGQSLGALEIVASQRSRSGDVFEDTTTVALSIGESTTR